MEENELCCMLKCVYRSRRYQTPAGKDINKIGILPDVDIPDGDLPLSDAEALCKVVQGNSASPLFP